jgi:hypothetical protein
MRAIQGLGAVMFAIGLMGCAGKSVTVAEVKAPPIDLAAYTPCEEQEFELSAANSAKTKVEKENLLQPELFTQTQKQARRLNVLP